MRYRRRMRGSWLEAAFDMMTWKSLRTWRWRYWVSPIRCWGWVRKSGSQAAYEGIGPRHSERLKEGLAATLAVLATTGTSVPAQARYVVDGAVSRMLSSANSDPMLYRWAAIAPWLPVLAEAAPRPF